PSTPTNAGESAPLQASITDAQAWDIISKHCTQCHSETPTSKLFQAAPLGFKLDSINDVKKASTLIHTRAVITKDMPLANMTNMTDAERETLGSWLIALKKEQ
ncbi:MAG: hypothetical protein V7683_16335, partial [Pseudoalteromonas distincta]